jgi:predicted ribosomally synthesized peptide with SipW-like signal peptide
MLRKLATLGGVGLAGIALIGAGAMATFTQETTSSQAVTAGTMNVVLSHNGGPQSQTLSLPAVGPVGSTFTMGPNEVQIDNIGNIPANEIKVQVTDANNNQALHDGVFVCLYSNGYLLFNEPLTVAEGYGPIAVGTQLVPPPDHYTLVVYAGGAYTGCGPTSTSIAGGAFQPGGPSYAGALPNLGTNPGAASLPNPAQGGTLIVKVTVSYEG